MYQLTLLPFGPTNAVAVFQRKIDEFIIETSLKNNYAYLDNITVAVMTQAEHDFNLKRLCKAAKENKLPLNSSKIVISVNSINLLGYVVSHNSIKADPERLQSLLNLSLPLNGKALQRTLGLFYSKFISKYFEKVRPLLQSSTFPLNQRATDAFKLLKNNIVNAVVKTIDEAIPFVAKMDASDFSFAATLNQNGQPVAFFTKSLNKHEIHQPAIVKEAYAIVEALRK